MQGTTLQLILLAALAFVLAGGFLFALRRMLRRPPGAPGEARQGEAARKTFLKVIPLLVLVFLLVSGFLVVRHILNLPFNSANRALHERRSAFNLDFLIPGGTYIDDRMTIGQVARLRLKRQSSFYEKALRGVSGLLPSRYRYLGDLLLFLFWTFLYMTFLRVFTFAGYGRALRGSLLCGALTYYFMPDLSPGSNDDMVFIALAAGVVILWNVNIRRGRRRRPARA